MTTPLPILDDRPPDERRHLRQLYATDASIYQHEPLAVVAPRSVDEIAALVARCAAAGTAILPRGGGTSLAGQCTNRAVVIDTSPHLRAVCSIDIENRACDVEPGITVDELNRHLDAARTGLFFAPDPATAAQACIGGCIGNNAAGARSIRYGRTSENVAAVDALLATGQRARFEPGAGRRDPVALGLAQGVARIVADYADDIRARFPKTRRRNAGYALDSILAQLDAGIDPADLDLVGLLCGSEGTLAITLGARLKLHPIPRSKGLAILSFASVDDAIAAVPACVQTGASAVELLDDVVLEAARGNAECRRYLELVPDAHGALPSAVLYVEYQEVGGIDEVHARFDRLRAAVGGTSMRTYIDAGALLKLWALRKAGEPLLHGLAGHRKPVTCVEDNAIPLENLARFVTEFRRIVDRHGTKAAYYAHASVGVLHVRPLLDLHDPGDLDRLRTIAVEVAELARQCGGVMSGEHGDGRLRGPLLPAFYGPRVMEAFARIKALFDPANLLNPGMESAPGPVKSITTGLRVQSLRWPANLQTYFDYGGPDAFHEAVEMCNGAGVCRKTAGGAMCPSYRATLDERHSTRGRANALRLAISGQVLPGEPAWDDPPTHDTLSLCLSCKACRSECPSNVDLATLKAEYTAQHYRHAGHIPLAARIFGHIRTLNRLASIAPSLANHVASFRPIRRLMDRVLGLAPQRSLPAFAPSLYSWFAAHEAPPDAASRPRVVLFADCFVTYNEPSIGQDAVRLLEALGYAVLLPRVGCCGRSMISNGLLDDATRSADKVLEQLRPFIEDDAVAAILVCEPSCLAAMKDEWLRLKLRTEMPLRQRLADKAMMVEEFVGQRWGAHPRPMQVPAEGAFAGRTVLFHGHCHQKALWGEQEAAAALRLALGDRLRILPSGCCGMAGAFGYTAERYEFSMRIAEQSLLGLIRQFPPDALIVAPGTSCRHQVRDGTSQEAIHPLQVLASLL